MSRENRVFKLTFLVVAKDWDEVITVFKKELGITKVKEDIGDYKMAGHYIVGLDLSDRDLSDGFYGKIHASSTITLLSDKASDERAQKILDLARPIELKLRELIIYAHELVDAYFDIIQPKSPVAKRFMGSKQLVGKEVLDSAVSFLDLGEIIKVLGSDGNEVDTTRPTDDIVKLLEATSNFEQFKEKLIKKFKRLTVWDVIAKTVLQQPISWLSIKDDLNELKNIRNVAAHFRIATPDNLKRATELSGSLLPQLSRKPDPDRKAIEEMAQTFSVWAKEYELFKEVNKAALDAIKVNNSFLTQATKDISNSFRSAIPDINSSISNFNTVSGSIYPDSLLRSMAFPDISSINPGAGLHKASPDIGKFLGSEYDSDQGDSEDEDSTSMAPVKKK
ncbi:MAG TPA: hypothetical protein VFT49_01475 [Candidatus Saccharimonadales bacterium]|nr:hypothetical protein [Candidatus Saccharimonadales bacterium]